jgi:hypothetical protein
MVRKIVQREQKPSRSVLPATLANLNQLSREGRELMFRCLKLNYEKGGDGTVAVDYGKDEVFIPDAYTVRGGGVEVFRLKPGLVKEFAEAVEDLGAPKPPGKTKSPPKKK